MKTSLKNIILSFISLVSFIIVFHSIIPHDYYYETISNFPHHEQHSENKTAIAHCHFFHEINPNNFYKNIKQNILVQSTKKQSFVLNIKQNNKLYSKIFFIRNNTFCYFVLIDISPTRGSPKHIFFAPESIV